MASESDPIDGLDVIEDAETASSPPHSPPEQGNDKCLGQHKDSSQNAQILVDIENANEGHEKSLCSYSEEKGADTFNEPRNFDLSITAPMFCDLSSTANLPSETWFCKVVDFYQHYDFFILLVAVILLAFAYPPLGAVYLQPQITASWIAVMYSFCTYSSAACMKSWNETLKRACFGQVLTLSTLVHYSCIRTPPQDRRIQRCLETTQIQRLRSGICIWSCFCSCFRDVKHPSCNKCSHCALGQRTGHMLMPSHGYQYSCHLLPDS